MKTSHHIIERRNRHLTALLALANSLNPDNKLSGLQLWRRLRRLESIAHSAATAQCNGESFHGQPYRNEEQWESLTEELVNRVAAIFGGRLPPGFFVNGDPRGYALKLDSGDGSKAATAFDLEQDWGRNQILAPLIDGGEA